MKQISLILEKTCSSLGISRFLVSTWERIYLKSIKTCILGKKGYVCIAIIVNKVFKIVFVPQIVASWVEFIDIYLTFTDQTPQTSTESELRNQSFGVLKVINHLAFFNAIIFNIFLFGDPFEVIVRTRFISIFYPASPQKGISDIGIVSLYKKYLLSGLGGEICSELLLNRL